MYERIIVPLDGTAFGEYALSWATEIATRSDAVLELVHIHVPAHYEQDLFEVPTYHYTGIVGSDSELDRSALRRDVEALEERARMLTSATGLRVRSRTISGNIDAALERETKAFGADLIVMSTHARTGLARSKLGSIADAVLRHATVPVLLVRPPAENATPDVPPVFGRIMVGLDGSTLSEQIIEPVARFARLFGARIHLVHVAVPPGDQTFSRIIRTSDDRSMRVELTGDQYLGHVAKQWAADIESPVLEVRRAPSPVTGLIAAALESDPDLIAMATHGRAGIKRILLGSTSGEVLANAGLPVLLFRPRHRAWGRSTEPAVVAEHTVV
ncbi:MAG TPA: universal stress protein [Longimicrobiales bacterium]|nr:universal stress protein [Longimicrobiales bacterium]